VLWFVVQAVYKMKYSVVIPVYNEEHNVTQLYKELKPVLLKLGSHEIIFVDDGSTDKTLEELKKLYERDSSVVIVEHQRNYGQTAAFYSGFQQARGEIVISMDGDLQNDPRDIPQLLKKLEEGYDAVAGWRYNRKDPWCYIIVSKIASVVRKWLTNDFTHDPGCSLRVYKSEAAKSLFVYGEMHRFITTLLIVEGYKIAELKVNHRPRKADKSKYKITKVFNGFVDLLNYKFWLKYSKRPLHFFFKYGLVMASLGAALLAYNLVKYGLGMELGPTLVIAFLLLTAALQFVGLGVLAELQIRSYYHSHPEQLAKIKKIYRKNAEHN